MKTREQIIKEIQELTNNTGYNPTPIKPKWQLQVDMDIMQMYAGATGYFFNSTDAFAIGYMCCQSNLDALFNNEANLRKAIDKYDETDPTGRWDTVGETFHDMFDYKFSE